MYFQLIKDKALDTYYGNVPIPDWTDTSQADTFEFGWSDMLLMRDDFTGPINSICDTLFDIGDVDFIPADKCVGLSRWLELRQESCRGRLHQLYGILYSYAQRAIDLDTGVVVEL